MIAKPATAVELQAGTLACSAANPGFRQFFNWMAAAFFNMLDDAEMRNGKYGLKVDLTVQDKPRLKVVYV